jgi:hypothetical protein
MAGGVPALLAKVARLRPRVVCFNGKGIWLHVERSLQQQQLTIQSDGDGSHDSSAAEVLKREDEEFKKPIMADTDQERPVKTERGLGARSLRRALLKKDTSSDGVAATSEMALPNKEEEDLKPPSVVLVHTDNDTKRERSASGASSSGSDAGRILRPSTEVTALVGYGSALSSPSSSPVSPRRTATVTQSTFAYGMQPYKAVHDVLPEVSKATGHCTRLVLSDTAYDIPLL